MSRKRQKEKTEKANTEEEASKNTPNEKLPAQTFDEYQCSGNVEIDFPGLCALLDMKDIPAVITKQPASSTAETEGGDTEDTQSQTNAAPLWSKPCLQVELETEDPLSTKSLKASDFLSHLQPSGWKVDEQIARVLQKMLPSLNKLQNLQFWQAGLTDRMVISLMNTTSLCSNLSAVTLEGNALPEQSYHLLLSEDSNLTHLSLRNNRIGDEGARVIGTALSTTRSANKSLMSLNLAFNSIGDAGAAHIAQGLRLNRALLFLSLSNNQIGDSGAAHLAAILGEFALTHEEVVERRKLLLERKQSPFRGDVDQSPAGHLTSGPSSTSLSKGTSKKKEASKKDEKPAANTENPKSNKKSSDIKVPQSKGGKLGGKEKPLSAQEDKSITTPNEEEAVEIVNPLLDQSVQHRDGEIFLPGNRTLTSLNLAGNRITEKSLPLFLKSLEMQGEGGGLLRLCLQRNHFPPECECYVKIKELMTLTDPVERNSSEQTEEEGHGA
ncbi:leucine-rich repeat-containing protein 71 isoform X9 [Micropterus dolomieu]|uniref:leucine-rich repeat-containing protein 71 isoform X9 n=1 Tax=Micropterus dolomieu TaxID=147949 RepID=UPI001E8E849F|nr:leucine-rich repeat-containing protein 71 isoform X9 [Micropterus dolomieu]